jgi:Na+/proline symporter
MVVGIWHARRVLRTVEDYISARGTARMAVSTATLAATAMGVWILFGPAEVGTFGGITAVGGYALGSAAPVLAFVWLGRRMRRVMPAGHSLTEYVWHRYGRAAYALTLSVMLFYMFIFLAAELTGISVAVRSLTGLPLWTTALVVGLSTVAYTAYGGLRSTIFTDALQFIILVPLLVVVFVSAVHLLGGPGQIVAQIQTEVPALLDPGSGVGIETGVALLLAVLAANLFHQGYWQRVWAARDEKVLWRSFGLAAALIAVFVFLAGLLGIMAQGAGRVTHPSAALFDLVQQVFPAWAILTVLLLGVVLATSSIDSLLNGLVSAFTADLHRVRPMVRAHALLRWGRAGTALIILPAFAIASQGYSVLYLFLLADLVAAAAVVPVFLGLFVQRYGAAEVIVGFMGGLVAGVLFFPGPDFRPWLPVPLGGNLMVSFLAAWLVSAALAVGLAALRARRGTGPSFDFRVLSERVQTIEG